MPGISAESWSWQLIPKWTQTTSLACLWRLIGIYVLFGELALEIWLACIVSMMCFSPYACVKDACLLLFIKRSLLDIAYAAFLWSCWWKMLYKRGWIEFSKPQSLPAIYCCLTPISKHQHSSQWASTAPCSTALALPSILKWNLLLPILHKYLVGNWSYKMKSHGSLRKFKIEDRCAVISLVLWLTLG